MQLHHPKEKTGKKLSRRHFIKLSSLWVMYLMGCANYDPETSGGKNFLRNNELRTIKPGYQGNPYMNGSFCGQYASDAGKSILKVLKWKFSFNPKAVQKKNDTFKLKVVNHDLLPNDKDNYIIWLGHASFFIRLNKKNILIDPCLTSPPLVRRLSKLPIDIKNIDVDYLLASHGHFDHLDSDSIKQLDYRNTTAFLPLKMGPLITSMNDKIITQEAGWYQQLNTGNEIELYLLPAYHWHKRTLTDLNSILWGSYIIKYKNKTIYFAGDSAYSSHFKEIGELFPQIDYAILPIGAYDPPFLMKDNHLNPEEAVKAYYDLNAKTLIPMHFGTFDITDEPIGEPIRWLNKLAKARSFHGDVQILDVGEILRI
jgi:L-ascorbate metabolism protein UlaG (beta-lactamase superfamily)